MEKKRFFCPVRHRWILSSPEERIRQGYLSYFCHILGYPLGMINLEVALHRLPRPFFSSLPPKRRIDLILYDGDLFTAKGRPLLIAEFKRKLSLKRDLHQIVGYNLHLHAYAILLADGESCFTFWNEGEALRSLPRPLSFSELKQLSFTS